MVTSFDTVPDDRYERHRLISWWDQERLASARIVVVGAGALGNEILKLLSLLGVGSILVVDFDTVSASNLSRTVLFREEDIGQPKASLAAMRARELNPDMNIAAIDGDLGLDLGLGTLRQADIVLAGLDSVQARWMLNRRCHQVGVPWINGGISETEGQVSRFVPGYGACYECTFSPSMVRRFNERYSCTNGLMRRVPDRAVPTTVVAASLVASLQVHDALRYLHDPESGLRAGHRLTVMMDNHRQVVDELPVNLNCEAHVSPIEIGMLVTEGASDLTPAELVNRAKEHLPGSDHLKLGFDLIESFNCLHCRVREDVCLPATRVWEDAARCKVCGHERQITRSESIIDGSSAWTLPLSRLGIANQEILQIADQCQTRKLWIKIGGPDPWHIGLGNHESSRVEE